MTVGKSQEGLGEVPQQFTDGSTVANNSNSNKTTTRRLVIRPTHFCLYVHLHSLLHAPSIYTSVLKIQGEMIVTIKIDYRSKHRSLSLSFTVSWWRILTITWKHSIKGLHFISAGMVGSLMRQSSQALLRQASSHLVFYIKNIIREFILRQKSWAEDKSGGI